VGCNDHVRMLDEAAIDFSMDPTPFRGRTKWWRTPFSLTLWPFYLSAVVSLLFYLFRVSQ